MGFILGLECRDADVLHMCSPDKAILGQLCVNEGKIGAPRMARGMWPASSTLRECYLRLGMCSSDSLRIYFLVTLMKSCQKICILWKRRGTSTRK